MPEEFRSNEKTVGQLLHEAHQRGGLEVVEVPKGVVMETPPALIIVATGERNVAGLKEILAPHISQVNSTTGN